MPLNKVYYAVVVTQCNNDEWLFSDMYWVPPEGVAASSEMAEAETAPGGLPIH
jgi:hypothetical protein